MTHGQEQRSDDQRSDDQLALQVARVAGRLLLDLRAQYEPLKQQDSGSLAQLRARGDSEANASILQTLARERPADAVLSEEAADDLTRLDAARVWIVDPLDGTWEYGQGLPEFAVQVALWDAAAGALIASTVDLPAQGVTRSTALPAAPPAAWPTDRPVRIAVSRTRPPQNLEAIIASLTASLGHPLGVQAHPVGSVGAKVEEVISGRAEAYLHDTGFHEWDVAAPYLVAQRSGLIAEHWDGTPVTFNRQPPWVSDLLVCQPSVHAQVRAAIASVGQS